MIKKLRRKIEIFLNLNLLSKMILYDNNFRGVENRYSILLSIIRKLDIAENQYFLIDSNSASILIYLKEGDTVLLTISFYSKFISDAYYRGKYRDNKKLVEVKKSLLRIIESRVRRCKKLHTNVS